MKPNPQPAPIFASRSVPRSIASSFSIFQPPLSPISSVSLSLLPVPSYLPLYYGPVYGFVAGELIRAP